jgi:hypothetical protein
MVARGQQTTTDILSGGNKAAIVESVLELELRTQASVSDFTTIRKVSSDNIEFIEPSRLSKHAFTLVAASQLREAKKDQVVQYLLFKKIFVRDGAAVVVLSHVTEGRPCFGAAFSHERSYTYETRRTSGGWVTQLIGRPVPVFLSRRNVMPRGPEHSRPKPNKSWTGAPGARFNLMD